MDATIREDSTQDWAIKPQTKSTTPTTITGQQHRTCKVHCPRNAGQIKQTATTTQITTNDRVRVLATNTETTDTATHIGDAGPTK